MEHTTSEIRLCVRKYNADSDLQINIVPERTAFLLVDCDESSAEKHVIENGICSALSIARESGMKIVYLFNAIYGVGGPNDVTTKIHGLDALENSWKPLIPKFNPSIQPLDDEAVIPKSHKDGFNGTVLDYYLKTWNIDTLITVGFHLKSCLFHTCIGARHHNYRVVMLRDCTNSSEFPDTIDDHNPEGGWLRFIFLRIYETDIGYTSTSYDLKRALLNDEGR
ncbi:cysteine hydrolase [Paenibacillus lycopersici]|uniref:Cysteine hydrolase n=1 Tax=Paenibacillus lycopersici TaxID=2704462 RepID=A0A6C0G014_9BACL|nr:isochorismatase family cysteine hydrolase [Paenibacillus lycopersici]QHT62748.1 cysteine hydrolase [Paenibacillus lycopersici]